MQSEDLKQYLDMIVLRNKHFCDVQYLEKKKKKFNEKLKHLFFEKTNNEIYDHLGSYIGHLLAQSNKHRIA